MEFELDVIRRISDLDYQRKVWIEYSLPNVIDSWANTMDDFDLISSNSSENMTPESYPEFGLSTLQIEQFKRLTNIVNNYDPKVGKSEDLDSKEVLEKILADPEWHQVVECAKETMKAFEGYNGANR
ncbi:MAG: hypothetical protein ACRYGR_02605 [Janthinobacterium lividum]